MLVEKIILISFLFGFGFCQFDPNFSENRTTIVHLFEWTWKDIADECERFLQHKGYGAVQISPPNENLIIENRPWWERYQPVSYVLKTRSGDENDFKDMTKRCNAVGVRIYVDAVINHMSAGTGVGTAGNKADHKYKMYPGVPYGITDFNRVCTVNNYRDVNNVRNCELVGLSDLNHKEEIVRKAISKYLNHLIDLGVAGFRIDAAKHIWPADLKNILDRLKDLNTEHGFAPNSKAFIYQEVIDDGQDVLKDYISIGAVTEFKYGNSISNVFKGRDKIKYLDSWGTKWGFLSEGVPIVFVDNHDTQRNEDKLIYKEAKEYKMANAFMLAHPYGIPKVMSSFDFTNKDQGPPQDSSGNLISPEIRPDNTCGNGYICEHRWRQIYSMVEFRNVVKGTPIDSWWSDDDQQAAFCRGNKGFVVFNNWGTDLRRPLYTCLPAGQYCDVITGAVENGKCTGKTITVADNGIGHFTLGRNEDDGVLAIHVNAKL